MSIYPDTQETFYFFFLLLDIIKLKGKDSFVFVFGDKARIKYSSSKAKLKHSNVLKFV